MSVDHPNEQCAYHYVELLTVTNVIKPEEDVIVTYIYGCILCGMRYTMDNLGNESEIYYDNPA